MSLRPVYERTLSTVAHFCPQRSETLSLHVINVCFGHHFRFAASRKWPPAEWPAGPPPTPRAARTSRPARAAGRWPEGREVSEGRWPWETTCPSSGRAGRSTEGGGFCGKWETIGNQLSEQRSTLKFITWRLVFSVSLSVCNPPFSWGYGLTDSDLSLCLCVSLPVCFFLSVYRSTPLPPFCLSVSLRLSTPLPPFCPHFSYCVCCTPSIFVLSSFWCVWLFLSSLMILHFLFSCIYIYWNTCGFVVVSSLYCILW